MVGSPGVFGWYFHHPDIGGEDNNYHPTPHVRAGPSVIPALWNNQHGVLAETKDGLGGNQPPV